MSAPKSSKTKTGEFQETQSLLTVNSSLFRFVYGGMKTCFLIVKHSIHHIATVFQFGTFQHHSKCCSVVEITGFRF